MGEWDGVWLVGERGLYISEDALCWQRLGPYEYPVKAVIRQPDRLVLATEWGLWEVRPGDDRWVQLHDENLTEVLDLAADSGDPGVAVASPYGVSRGHRGEHGAVRWTSLTEELVPDRRFTNALLEAPGGPGCWLAGTEAGILRVGANAEVVDTDLPAVPVRALCRDGARFWAGTDTAGVWCSDDGLHWRRSGAWDWGAVFCLEVTDGMILAGSEAGVVCGDGESPWRRCGPRVAATALAAEVEGPWLMGSSPGGLWRSDDSGARWNQVGSLRNARFIAAPEGK
jgi:hypothetical protein